jgi:hypothetical protein
MKTKLTILWASATLALAFANVPTTAGQEKGKAVVKMQTGMKTHESVTGSSEVELRFEMGDNNARHTADSSITYSASGEKITKYVYDHEKYSGIKYRWANNAWEETGAFWTSYGWPGVYYGPVDGDDSKWMFAYPYGRFGYIYWEWEMSDEAKERVERIYNSEGYLTHVYDRRSDYATYIYEITYYNTDTKYTYRPVLIKYYGIIHADNNRVQNYWQRKYEYNTSGELTLVEAYVWDSDKNDWIVENMLPVTYGKEVNTYLNNGDQLALRIRYSADAARNRWVESSKTESEFNSDNVESRINEYAWHENRWVLTQYTVHYYPDPSGNIPVSAGSNVWSSGGQLYIAATANGAAQVYAVSGQLLKTVALTAGQTTAMPLPRGVYIVVAGGKTWKVTL